MKGLWQRVMLQSDVQVVAIQESHRNTIAELQHDLQKYKNNNQRWQGLYNQWAKDKGQLTNDKLGLEAAVTELQKGNDLLNSKQEALSQQIQDKQERITELHRLHSQAQGNLEHYRESAREQRLAEQQRFEQQLQQLEQTINQLQQRLTSLHQEKLLLQQEHDKITLEKNTIQIEHEKLSGQFVKLQHGYSCVEKELHENIQAKNQWLLQYQMAEKKVENQNNSLVDVQKQLAVLSQQLSSAQKQVKGLNEQNKFLVLEKWEIGQEKSKLEGELKQLQVMLKNKIIA